MALKNFQQWNRCTRILFHTRRRARFWQPDLNCRRLFSWNMPLDIQGAPSMFVHLPSQSILEGTTYCSHVSKTNRAPFVLVRTLLSRPAPTRGPPHPPTLLEIPATFP